MNNKFFTTKEVTDSNHVIFLLAFLANLGLGRYRYIELSEIMLFSERDTLRQGRMYANDEVQKPMREPDYISKRGVHYYWAPDWIRGNSSNNKSFGRIKAIKEKNGEVNLYMKSKSGNLSYIQGSIQKEFRQWHLDREIDYILLGLSSDEIIKNETE